MDPRHDGATTSSPLTGIHAPGAGDIEPAGPRQARARLGFIALALAVHASALLVVSFVPPDPWGLAAEAFLGADDRLAAFATNALEPIERVEVAVASPPGAPRGDEGRRHHGEEGSLGDRDAPETGARSAIAGRSREQDPRMAREPGAVVVAATSGILAALSRQNAPTSPFVGDVASGLDPEDAMGILLGTRIGDGFGYGGISLRGMGRGGGGDGAGTIGLGTLRTIGRGVGAPGAYRTAGCGVRTCAAGLRRRASRAPAVHVCGAGPCVDVRGALSRETIRRYIRRNIDSIRYCYEQELIGRPDLEGRVAVRFVISGQGAVASSTVDSSTLGDPAAEQCVARAVQRIGFPGSDDGGPVVVTYPFVFTAVD